MVALEHYLFIRVFDVLIITEEAPDSWLVIFNNEVEDDHRQGEPSDHRELHPSLDNHIPGLGYHSRHPDVFVLFLSLSFDEAYERASLLTKFSAQNQCNKQILQLLKRIQNRQIIDSLITVN